MNNIQDKIRGTFLGVAIGDSLGKPVEMMSAERIAEKYGRITDYEDCRNHKYFENDPKGTTTDDWQLTKATARGFITAGAFDLQEIAKEHIKEYAISVRGWGGSTRESVANLAEGMSLDDAGKTDKENRGTGNGICMKASPIGLYMGMTNPGCENPPWDEHVNNIANFAKMTHRTSMAITSGLAHAFATFRCFTTTPEKFDKKAFCKMLRGAAALGNQFMPETLQDDMAKRFAVLEKDLLTNDIIDLFGAGSCYVYDSLPFTYAFFLRNPRSIESMYDCVSAGGDADSNGSMLGGLLGSLNGTSIFPKHLIDGLKEKDEVIAVADAFYEKFK